MEWNSVCLEYCQGERNHESILCVMCSVVQHDNNPKQVCSSEELPLGEQSEHIDVPFKWPACKLNLNPFENPWCVLKTKVHARGPSSNREELERFINK